MRGETLVRDISGWFVTRQVMKHLVSVDGLENLPEEGSFVLAPNHRSYFDHFVMEVLVRAVTGRPVWFLTKRESFVHTLPRLWTTAWYGIPVDRNVPSPDTLRAVRAVLSSGDILCVYPEGTRNTGEDLLPFHAGAFRFALAADAPLIPVAMTGTADVLGKGDRWFRRRGIVRVVFGAPLRPESGVGKRVAAELLAQETRVAIGQLLAVAAEDGDTVTSRRTHTAGSVLDERITDALDSNGRLARTDARRLKLLADLLRPMEPVRHHIATQRARLKGLAALRLPLPMQAVSALGVKRTVEQVLQRDPTHRDANYLLGRWHLAAPSVLGGSPHEAVRAFTNSVAASAVGDTRALVGLADAHLAAGDRDSAVAALQQAAIAPTVSGSRAALRSDRIRARLLALDTAPLPAPQSRVKELLG